MNNANAAAERRRFQRIQLERAATITVDGKTIECELVDISLKGALLRYGSDWAPEIGRRTDLLVLLDTQSSSCIRVVAEVAHLGRNSIGVHIYSMDLESSENLRRLVEINLGDTTLLERELGAMLDDV